MKSLVPLLGSWVLKGLYGSLRVRHVRLDLIDNASQYILTFWHSHLLLMLHARYRRPISALVSQSRDGEMIAQVFDHYGVDSSRGSSTRGGAAGLRDMLRRARDGHNLAITPDGPRGPARIAKEGVVIAAQATGLPILPVAFAAKKKSCCAPGIAWSRHIRSRARSISTASRSTSLATAMSRNGGLAWKQP